MNKNDKRFYHIDSMWTVMDNPSNISYGNSKYLIHWCKKEGPIVGIWERRIERNKDIKQGPNIDGYCSHCRTEPPEHIKEAYNKIPMYSILENLLRKV